MRYRATAVYMVYTHVLIDYYFSTINPPFVFETNPVGRVQRGVVVSKGVHPRQRHRGQDVARRTSWRFGFAHERGAKSDQAKRVPARHRTQVYGGTI